jgi:AAHS family 4-hydroxybenzoate transporter-like MFS transporter
VNHSPTVSEIIDKAPLSRYQITTVLLCGLVLVLDGFDTQSIGFLAPAMAESLQVPVKTFGPVFAAALLGLMISSMTAGPIADRLGRKWPIVTSTLIFATFALITTSVSSLNQLMAYRFLTGLGLGGAMPSVVALTSEYAPKKLQQILVTMLFCGMPLGAFLGGIVSAVILPIWGWRAVFYVGGILPIVVALVLIKILPESIRFLALTSADRTNADEILSRISPGFVRGSVDYSISVDKLRTGVPFMYLFRVCARRGRGGGRFPGAVRAIRQL